MIWIIEIFSQYLKWQISVLTPLFSGLSNFLNTFTSPKVRTVCFLNFKNMSQILRNVLNSGMKNKSSNWFSISDFEFKIGYLAVFFNFANNNENLSFYCHNACTSNKCTVIILLGTARIQFFKLIQFCNWFDYQKSKQRCNCYTTSYL